MLVGCRSVQQLPRGLCCTSRSFSSTTGLAVGLRVIWSLLMWDRVLGRGCITCVIDYLLSLYTVPHYTTPYDLLQGLKAQHVLPPIAGIETRNALLLVALRDKSANTGMSRSSRSPQNLTRSICPVMATCLYEFSYHPTVNRLTDHISWI